MVASDPVGKRLEKTFLRTTVSSWVYIFFLTLKCCLRRKWKCILEIQHLTIKCENTKFTYLQQYVKFARMNTRTKMLSLMQAQCAERYFPLFTPAALNLANIPPDAGCHKQKSTHRSYFGASRLSNWTFRRVWCSVGAAAASKCKKKKGEKNSQSMLSFLIGCLSVRTLVSSPDMADLEIAGTKHAVYRGYTLVGCWASRVSTVKFWFTAPALIQSQKNGG